MNGIDPNMTIQWLSTNAWWVVLSTVAILIGSYTSVFERVEKYIKKPKLAFETREFTDRFKNEKGEEYQKESYWIYISNHGKELAKQCRVKMKIIDTATSKPIESEMTMPYKSGTFSISWKDGYKEKDVLDIYPKDTGMFKIPLNVLSPPQNNPSGEIILEWEEPIRKPDPTIPVNLMSGITFFHFTITVYINAENANPLTKEFDLLMLTGSVYDTRKVSFTVKESK